MADVDALRADFPCRDAFSGRFLASMSIMSIYRPLWPLKAFQGLLRLSEKQLDWPQGLLPVRLFALRAKSRRFYFFYRPP